MGFSLQPADRPQTVTWFEWLSTLVIIAELISSGFHWFVVIWSPLMLWLIISISRRRSSLARWIFTGLYALGFIAGTYRLAAGTVDLAALGPMEWALTIANLLQLWLVWSPDTSQWIASRRRSGPELRA